ncbi:DUF983 domain-containing protein [Prosthecomicrobium sp. N25]|uniref:DUF983 domain-containing protein n=1 Tax=Prosthecomicrobium sp. N25 TaxID=3129254 RepID=UPI0030776114
MSVKYGDETAALAAALPERSVGTAMKRGAIGRCPSCGEGHLFNGYTKVVDHCEVCGEALHHHRADDFPPYATIFIVGHVVIPAMYFVEKTWRPDLWIHAALWLPLTLVLSIALLRPIKGAIVGLQWALRMHGFNPAGDDEALPEPRPAEVRIEGRL